MPFDWEVNDEILAAASRCPVPDCGSLVIEYRATSGVSLDPAEQWEFTCSRCGIAFAVTQEGLLFQSVPKQWLSPNTCSAS